MKSIKLIGILFLFSFFYTFKNLAQKDKSVRCISSEAGSPVDVVLYKGREIKVSDINHLDLEPGDLFYVRPLGDRSRVHLPEEGG